MLGLSFDDYLSFCFDEACEYIMSFKKQKRDGDYIKEYWDPKPKWNDEKSKSSNKELFSEMQDYLKKHQ